MEKIFNNANFETKDNIKIHYSTPKTYKEGVMISEAKYLEDGERFNLAFETDVFVLHTGIQKSPNNIHYIDLEFNNGNDALHEFIGELDELGMGTTWNKSKKWFGTQMDQDLIDSFYKFPLRTNKRGIPYLRLKLDENNLVVKNQYGAKISLDTINSESKVKVKIRYDGLLFYKQLFTPVYYVYEIKHYQQRKRVGDGYSFYTYDNDLPEMVLDEDEKGFETDAEELFEFANKNEEVVRNLLGINEEQNAEEENEEQNAEEENEEVNAEENEEENEEEQNEEEQNAEENEEVNVEGDDEEKNEEDDGEDNEEEENAEEDGEEEEEGDEEEENEEGDEEEENGEVEQNAEEGEEKGGLDGNVEDVEENECEEEVDVEVEEEMEEEKVVEEEKRDDEIGEILSKNLTKVLEADEQTLAIYEDEPLEEQEKKLREMLRRVEMAKTQNSLTGVSETSSGSKRGKSKRILRYSKTRVVNQQM